MLSFPFFAPSRRLGRLLRRNVHQSSNAVLMALRLGTTLDSPHVSFSPFMTPQTPPLAALSPSLCSILCRSPLRTDSTQDAIQKEQRTIPTSVRRRRGGAPLSSPIHSPLSSSFSFWSSAIRRAVMRPGGAQCGGRTIPLAFHVASREESSHVPSERTRTTTESDVPPHQCHPSDAAASKRMPNDIADGILTHAEKEKKVLGMVEKEKEEALLRMWRDTSVHPSVSPSSPHSTTRSSASMEERRNEKQSSHGLTDPSHREISSLSSRTSTATPSPLPPATGAPPAAGDTFQDSRPCDPKESTEVKRRRLQYQSQYRGMVEMDLIFGHFARCKLAQLPREMLMEYDVLLKQLDNDLFKWLVMEEEAPQAIASLTCFEVLKKFVDEEKKELLECY